MNHEYQQIRFENELGCLAYVLKSILPRKCKKTAIFDKTFLSNGYIVSFHQPVAKWLITNG